MININEIRKKYKSMKVKELRDEAKNLGIILGSVTKKADIVEKIIEEHYIETKNEISKNVNMNSKEEDNMKVFDIMEFGAYSEEKSIDELLEEEGITKDLLNEIDSIEDEIKEIDEELYKGIEEKDNYKEEVENLKEEEIEPELSEDSELEKVAEKIENTITEIVEVTNEKKQDDESKENLEGDIEELNIEVDSVMSTQRVELEIDLLDDSPFNFFKPISESKFKEMVESIKANGVLQPIIVRAKSNGRFEILAGHNRKNASIEAEKTTIPAIVVNVDDDKAKEIIVDTNVVQRDEKTPMEIARAYKIKAEAIGKRQGARVDLSGEEKGLTRDIIGKKYEVSGMTVERYLRLNNLLPEFQKLVDNGIMKVKSAFELGLVDEETQKHILELIDIDDKEDLKLLSLKKINEIKKALKDKNKLSKEEKQKLKEEGKEPKYKPLSLEEIKSILVDETSDKAKDLVVKIKVPADYDKETIEFIEGNIIPDPEWLLKVIKDIAHRKIII